MSTNIALAGLPPPQNLGMIPIAEKTGVIIALENVWNNLWP